MLCCAVLYCAVLCCPGLLHSDLASNILGAWYPKRRIMTKKFDLRLMWWLLLGHGITQPLHALLITTISQLLV